MFVRYGELERDASQSKADVLNINVGTFTRLKSSKLDIYSPKYSCEKAPKRLFIFEIGGPHQ